MKRYMKQYLVSYAINHFDRPMFYNEIVKCRGDALSILECIRSSRPDVQKDNVRLINFWQI